MDIQAEVERRIRDALRDAFVEAGMAEFDAMDRDTAMIKYQMKADDWDDWRPRWCMLHDLPPES